MVLKRTTTPQAAEKRTPLSKAAIAALAKSAPDEKGADLSTSRESRTFRVHPQIWIDFDRWCAMNQTTRSAELEKYMLMLMGKTTNEYVDAIK